MRDIQSGFDAGAWGGSKSMMDKLLND
jgi:hypothetical protein